MPVIADTAYPRLSASPGQAELNEAFTPTAAEIAFAVRRTRRPATRLALLVLLKTFQRLGYFIQFADLPSAVASHVATAAGVPTAVVAGLGKYDGSTYRMRLMGLVRGFLSVCAYDATARRLAVAASLEAARTREDLADIVNATLEELVRHRRELPAFSTLLRIALTARALVNRSYYRRIATAVGEKVRARLDALLLVPEDAARSPWDQVKAEAPRPSPQRMREFLIHLRWLREHGPDEATFTGVPDQKIKQFAAEARSLNAAGLARMAAPKRTALVAALLNRQLAQALDDLTAMFVRLTQRMHNRAKQALAEHQVGHAEETDALVALLRHTVLACRDGGDREARLGAVEALLLPEADDILARCEAHAALAGNNYLPLLTRFYKGQRAAFLRFLEHVKPVSTSQDRAVEEAVTFLLAHRTHHHPRLRIACEEAADSGERAMRQRVDLSFVGERWWSLVTGQRAREPDPVEVDRRYFEVCLFTQVMIELKSGDLCISGSEAYSDYRNQLVSWEDYTRDLPAYAEQAGVPPDPQAFVAALQQHLAETAAAVDRAFPANQHVEIVRGEPVIKRRRAQPEAEGAAGLERLLKERMWPVGIWEALADTEHWLNWTRHFGPVSGFEAKLDRPRERYLAIAFCYGCGLGPTPGATHEKPIILG